MKICKNSILTASDYCLHIGFICFNESPLKNNKAFLFYLQNSCHFTLAEDFTFLS